ncbi:MAG: hypothetical protein HHJ11_05740 [Phycicoccus sp.]|nr:hypothetical protein [Phycicoccus sp.]NMM34378.1 hypothetical protein [Phycicoccus sp.]
MRGLPVVGFGGFASVVDSLDVANKSFNDANALVYVHACHSDRPCDSGHVQRRRQSLGTLLGRAASPANILLPWRLHTTSGRRLRAAP